VSIKIAGGEDDRILAALRTRTTGTLVALARNTRVQGASVKTLDHELDGAWLRRSWRQRREMIIQVLTEREGA
jgi:hypothetical protein